jgi:hypothetical protein
MGWTESPTINRPRRALLLSQQPLEPVAASRMEKYPVNAPSPQAPCFGRKKEKNRAQSRPRLRPNSFRYGRSAVAFSASDVTAPHRTVEKYHTRGFQRGNDRGHARIPTRPLDDFDLVDRGNADVCHAREIARRPSKQGATVSDPRA